MRPGPSKPVARPLCPIPAALCDLRLEAARQSRLAFARLDSSYRRQLCDLQDGQTVYAQKLIPGARRHVIAEVPNNNLLDILRVGNVALIFTDPQRNYREEPQVEPPSEEQFSLEEMFPSDRHFGR